MNISLKNTFFLVFIFCAIGLMIVIPSAFSENEEECNIPEFKFSPPPDIYDKDTVKDCLFSEGIVYGTKLASPSTATIKTIALTGNMGIVHIDVTKTGPSEIVNLVNTLNGSDTIVTGDFKDPYDPDLKQKLDAGLQGAILKGAESPEEVRAFLERLYFSPMGNRPGGPANANSYLAGFQEMVERANQLIIGGITIETSKGAKNIAKIIEETKGRGLGLIIVDRKELASSVKDTAEFEELLSLIENEAKKASIPLGTIAMDKTEALDLARNGYKYFIIGSDLEAIEKAFENFKDIPADKTIEASPLEEVLDKKEDNNIETLLKKGKLIPVGFLMTPDIEAARVLSLKSTALWIDAEHGPFTKENIKEIIDSLPEQANIFVRVGCYNHPDIKFYLDMGAEGIISPEINSREKAEYFVKTVKGENPDALAVIIIENAEGVENIEEILSVEGIDIVHTGPYDLSLSLRTEIGSDLHREKIARIEEAVIKAGLPLGGATISRSDAYKKYEKGYRFLTTVSDQEGIMAFYKNIISE